MSFSVHRQSAAYIAKLGPNAVWDMPGYKVSIWCRLQILEIRHLHSKGSSGWDGLWRADCDVIDLQMQPLNENISLSTRS